MKALQHNLLPFYRGDVAEARKGVLNSPVTTLPHWQVFVPGTYSAVSNLRLRNVRTGAFTVLSGVVPEAATVTGGTFYTYKGTAVPTIVPNEVYQIELTLANGSVFYSHAICPTHLFESSLCSLAITSCTSSSGGAVYSLGLTATIAAGATFSILVDDDNSTAAMYVDRAFNITQAFPTAAGGAFSISITIVATVELPNGGSITHRLVRRLTYTAASPCGTQALATLSSVVTRSEEVMVLEVTNSAADLAPLNQMYQTNFIQQLFLVGYQSLPTPVITENFTESSAGLPAFAGANYRTQLNIDFFPCPDAVALAIPALRYAKGVRLVNRQQGLTYNVDRMNLATIAVEGEDVSAGTLQLEVDSTRIDRCETNFTVTIQPGG